MRALIEEHSKLKDIVKEELSVCVKRDEFAKLSAARTLPSSNVLPANLQQVLKSYARVDDVAKPLQNVKVIVEKLHARCNEKLVDRSELERAEERL